MERAKSARQTAEGPGPNWIGPKADVNKLMDECRDTSTRVTTFFKTLLVGPMIVEDDIYQSVCPYETAIDKGAFTLKSRYKELEGEESDNEWINDNDPKDRGTSTGKGIRHQYEIVEKQRQARTHRT